MYVIYFIYIYYIYVIYIYMLYVLCMYIYIQGKCVTSRGNEKKRLQVFLYTINSCHSCNSFLYLRFRFNINNFRTIVLEEFFLPHFY